MGLVVECSVLQTEQNQFGKTIAQAGLIHVIVTVFLAVYFSVGNRADSLILSLGLCAGGTMIKRKQVAMLFTAFCIAGAVNSRYCGSLHTPNNCLYGYLKRMEIPSDNSPFHWPIPYALPDLSSISNPTLRKLHFNGDFSNLRLLFFRKILDLDCT